MCFVMIFIGVSFFIIFLPVVCQIFYISSRTITQITRGGITTKTEGELYCHQSQQRNVEVNSGSNRCDQQEKPREFWNHVFAAPDYLFLIFARSFETNDMLPYNFHNTLALSHIEILGERMIVYSRSTTRQPFRLSFITGGLLHGTTG